MHTVPCIHHMHGKLVFCLIQPAVCSARCVAASAKNSQKFPLRSQFRLSFHRMNCPHDLGQLALTDFHCQNALTGRRNKLLHRQMFKIQGICSFCLRFRHAQLPGPLRTCPGSQIFSTNPQPVQPCRSQQNSIILSTLQFFEPCLHISAKKLYLHLWIHLPDLDLAAQRTGPDHTARYHVPDRRPVCCHHHIRRIFAGENRPHCQTLRKFHRHIFCTVNSQINLAL